MHCSLLRIPRLTPAPFSKDLKRITNEGASERVLEASVGIPKPQEDQSRKMSVTYACTMHTCMYHAHSSEIKHLGYPGILKRAIWYPEEGQILVTLLPLIYFGA